MAMSREDFGRREEIERGEDLERPSMAQNTTNIHEIHQNANSNHYQMYSSLYFAAQEKQEGRHESQHHSLRSAERNLIQLGRNTEKAQRHSQWEGRKKALSKKDEDFCSAARTDYEKACYDESKLSEIPEIDPELIKNAIDVTRILHAYIEQCVRECHQDSVCECLDLCNRTRRYIRRCWTKRHEYVRHCSSNEDTHTRQEAMADNFAILLFKQLRTEYDERLSELCEGIFKLNGKAFDPTKEYSPDLPAPEDESGVDDSGSVVDKAGYILGRIQAYKRPALYHFLKTVHGMSTITFNDDGKVDWEFATVILGNTPNAMHLSIQNYHDLVVACKFDRTVFAKVVKLIKFMHVNSLAFDDDGTEKTPFVTLKWNFLIQTLKALGKHKSVWSFIRLPSSTSVLIQIMLSDSLLNTSFLRNKFTFNRAEMVDTLAYALTTPRVVNAFNQRSDIAELTRKYIRRSPIELKAGFRPTWLLEVITRGDYGKVLLALKNAIDTDPQEASAAYMGTGDTVFDVISHYSKALDDKLSFKLFKKEGKFYTLSGLPLKMQLEGIEDTVGGTPESKGDTIFELNSTSNESKLIRGEYEITSSGRVRITTDEDIDKNTWTKIYLPVDETLVGDTFNPFEEVRECLFKMMPSVGKSMDFYNSKETLFSRSTRELPVKKINAVHDLGFGHRHTWSCVQDILWAKW